MTTDPNTRADDWLERARAKLAGAALGPRAEQIGRVEEVGDGIALVSGLRNVRLDELLRFEKGIIYLTPWVGIDIFWSRYPQGGCGDRLSKEF
jgi:F0F1-type ATP synthase alpha subunit